MKSSMQFLRFRFVIIALALLGLLLLLKAPVEQGFLSNAAARCALHSMTSYVADSSLCIKSSQNQIIAYDNLSQWGRFAYYVGQFDVAERALKQVNIEQIGQLEAYFLIEILKERSQFADVEAFIVRSNLPTEKLVKWAVSADQVGDKSAAKFWLRVAEDNKTDTLDWSTRRWLGWLWWSLEENEEVSRQYLESVVAEAPEALQPKLWLASIYQESDIDKSIMLLEEANQLKPDNLEVMYRLWQTYQMRGHSSDWNQRSRVEEKALPLLLLHLENQPGDTRFRAWLDEIRSDS